MGIKFPFPSLWPLFHYCQILSSLRRYTWMPLMDPEPQKWQKVCFYERLKKNYLFKLYFFLYRGILAFCSNDVTNHTFGSGHPIQPLWSFASNRVSFCFFHVCREFCISSYGQIRLELCLLLLLPYHRMSGQLPVEWRVVEDAEISKLAR